MRRPWRGRAYRALLFFFPPSVRRERGEGLELLFTELASDWEERCGGLGPVFWMCVAWDALRAAALEWLALGYRFLRSLATRRWGEEMGNLMGDARLAVRQLVRQPTYCVMVMVLMALAVAGNAAVFRVFNGLFLRPLPFDEPGRLVDLDETAPAWDLEYLSIAYRDFAAWRDQNSTFEAMAAIDFSGGNFVADGAPRRVSYLLATHDIDEVLRLRPPLGRFFGAEEDRPDAPRVAMLSHGFWEQEFASDPEVLGRTVSVDGQSVEIVGVLPPEAEFVGEAELWMPLRQDATQWFGWGLSGVGRMAASVSMEAARDDLMSIHKGMIPEFEVNEISSPVVSSLRDRYLGDYRPSSSLLLGAVGIVLLIACANIAGLMVVRSIARSSEMSVRVAMGAPRSRIVRQLLTESAVLAALGGALGVGLGVWGSELVVGPLGEQFPRWVTFDLDARFVVFTVGVTALAALVFGLLPALRTAGRNVGSVAGARRSTATGSARRVTSALVAGEVALALALLVVGGLSVLDVRALADADPGFDPAGLLSYGVSLPSSRYGDGPARLAFADEYVERLSAVPGVRSAAVASSLPLSGHWGWFFVVDGAPPLGEDEANPVVLNRVVSPGYFETLGVEIVAGRPFDRFDGREVGRPVIIVNETFVRTHLAHLDDPLGARLHAGTATPAEDAEWLTVVGVARDVKHYGVDEEMRPGVYQPIAQLPLGGFQVAVATQGDPAPIVSAARAVTSEMDVELPVYQVRAMTEELDRDLWTRRATSWLIAAFATVALLMAVAGIYGVISYSVGQRRQEISIRMAMGAQKSRVLRDAVWQGMVLVGVGAAIGLALARLGAALVARILVDVSATDPRVYAAVTALVVAVAAVANFLPARRAARMDPMGALRGD